jgi:hypothetical protein
MWPLLRRNLTCLPMAAPSLQPERQHRLLPGFHNLLVTDDNNFLMAAPSLQTFLPWQSHPYNQNGSAAYLTSFFTTCQSLMTTTFRWQLHPYNLRCARVIWLFSRPPFAFTKGLRWLYLHPNSEAGNAISTTWQRPRAHGTCRAPAAGVGYARPTRLKHVPFATLRSQQRCSAAASLPFRSTRQPWEQRNFRWQFTASRSRTQRSG